MKTKYIFFSLVALCMLSACTKDEEVAITTVQINNLSIVPQYTRSAFACDLVANSPIADVELQYSTDSLFGEGLYQTLQLNQNEHHYTANLESLQQGQTYYVRYKVFNSFNSMIPTRVDTFRTRAYTLPSVRTDSVTHITTHSADCYFTLTDWGCDSLPIVGVCFSTSLSDRTNIPCTTTLSDSTFVCSLSELTDGKTYSVYAFAKNAQGTAYSEKVIKFTTIAIVVPTITTADITDPILLPPAVATLLPMVMPRLPNEVSAMLLRLNLPPKILLSYVAAVQVLSLPYCLIYKTALLIMSALLLPIARERRMASKRHLPLPLILCQPLPPQR